MANVCIGYWYLHWSLQDQVMEWLHLRRFCSDCNRRRTSVARFSKKWPAIQFYQKSHWINWQHLFWNRSKRSLRNRMCSQSINQPTFAKNVMVQVSKNTGTIEFLRLFLEFFGDFLEFWEQNCRKCSHPTNSIMDWLHLRFRRLRLLRFQNKCCHFIQWLFW